MQDFLDGTPEEVVWVAVELNAGTFGSNVILGKQPPH
jgi:hypothetical protein